MALSTFDHATIINFLLRKLCNTFTTPYKKAKIDVNNTHALNVVVTYEAAIHQHDRHLRERILKYQLPKPVIALTIGVVAIIALGGIFHLAINHQLHSWKLLPEPERLTELYFTDPNHLPSSYVPGQPQTVKFTVHNLEYRTTAYKYLITETSQDGKQSQQLADGTFSLPQNGYQKPVVNIPTVNLGPSVKVEVRLVGQNESIDYLLREET